MQALLHFASVKFDDLSRYHDPEILAPRYSGRSLWQTPAVGSQRWTYFDLGNDS